MPMIDTAMLAAMREAIDELLPDTCNVLTVTQTSNGQGGMTETWGTAYADINCRLDVNSKREGTQGGAVQQFTGYTLSLPYDTVINDIDRIELDDVTYAVTGINDGQSWMAVKRVTLEAV